MTTKARPGKITTIEAAVQVLGGPGEIRQFLIAMLSEQEFEQLGKRWRAYQLRRQGYTLKEVKELTPIAMGTATRVSRLCNGPERAILDTMLRRVAEQKS